jgi:predicted Rossmann fold nucleotide-binding protein DprA/Smf involved in DNA uptake
MTPAPPRDPREVIRDEPIMHRPVLEALREGPLTVPQIAEAIGHPAHEVMFWVMGMRRYRMVVELPDADDDGYFQYRAMDLEVRA